MSGSLIRSEDIYVVVGADTASELDAAPRDSADSERWVLSIEFRAHLICKPRKQATLDL
jgi:hypothetical protein